MSETPKTRIRPGVVVTIHRCELCGLWEGERPQAGCCPRCGTASDPISVKVKVLDGA